MKYHFFHDPAHGWLAVPRVTLEGLKIAHRISSFSYQRDDMVYLEEDCDAPLFLAQLEENPEIEDHHTDRESRIRNYQPYH